MEFIVYLLWALVAADGLFIWVIADGKHESAVLWSVWFGLVLICTAVACWQQKNISDKKHPAKQEASQSTASTDDDLVAILPPSDLMLTAGQAAQVAWDIKNAATKRIDTVGTVGGIRIRDKGDDDFSKEIAAAQKLAVHRGPQATLPANAQAGNLVWDSSPLSEVTLKAIMSGDKVFNTYFVLLYLDSAKQPRVSTSCSFFDPARGALLSRMKYQKVGVAVSWGDIEIPNRPKLVPVVSEAIKRPGDSTALFSIKFENQGATTASNVKIGAGFNIAPVEQLDVHVGEMFKDIAKAQWKDRQDIGALDILDMKTESPLAASEGEIRAMLERKAVLILIMRIEYTDEKSGHHWTNYCGTFDGRELKPYDKFIGSDSNDGS